MANKNDFISQLDEALARDFHYDYEINWNKAEHAVTLSFLLEAENTDGTRLVDADGNENDDNVLYEDSVLFYDPEKTDFTESDFLAAVPFDDKGLSREFIDFFVGFLQETADQGLADLLDFLENDEEAFEIHWDWEKFDAGDEKLVETEFYRYPRY